MQGQAFQIVNFATIWAPFFILVMLQLLQIYKIQSEEMKRNIISLIVVTGVSAIMSIPVIFFKARSYGVCQQYYNRFVALIILIITPAVCVYFSLATSNSNKFISGLVIFPVFIALVYVINIFYMLIFVIPLSTNTPLKNVCSLICKIDKDRKYLKLNQRLTHFYSYCSLERW